MNDTDIEKALRRYRVIAPPPSLALRVVAWQRERRASHAWGALAAAAVVAIWVSIQAVTRVSISDPVRENDLAVVVEVLGGGENARQYAEEIVPRGEPALAGENAVEVTW